MKSMFKLPFFAVFFTGIGCNYLITPALAESINVQFTGIVEKYISINISSPPSEGLAIDRSFDAARIATSSPNSLQIPPVPYLPTVQVNSSQPVNIILTSTETPEQVIKNLSPGKTNLQLPLTNSPQFHITVVPQ